MSKITRWRRGLWAAGQWWSNAWPWMMSSGSRGARNLQFQTTQFIVLIFLLLLALTSAVIRPPYDYPTKLSSTFQPNKHLRVNRRSPSSSRYYRPSSTLSHTTHCFFNQLCSCKVIRRRAGHDESTSVDDFGNVDYYDGFPVRDLVKSDSSLLQTPTLPSSVKSTEVYQGQFGRVSTGSSVFSEGGYSTTENTNKFNATSNTRVSNLLSEFLPQPSRLKGTRRGKVRGRGRTRAQFFNRNAKNVQDVSCVGVPFTTVPGNFKHLCSINSFMEYDNFLMLINPTLVLNDVPFLPNLLKNSVILTSAI